MSLLGVESLLGFPVIFTAFFFFLIKILYEQLPRLYNVYKQMGTVTSFQNILDNVFIPLFEVTINPSSHPQLHVFLMQVNLSHSFSYLNILYIRYNLIGM